jgi:hypothetical protein
MSAFAPKATEPLHRRKMMRCANGLRTFECTAANDLLFDHLVSLREEYRRNFEPKSRGRLEIDGEFKFCHLLDWKFGGLCAFENRRNITNCGLVECPPTGSFASIPSCAAYVRFAPDSDRIADILDRQLRANRRHWLVAVFSPECGQNPVGSVDD